MEGPEPVTWWRTPVAARFLGLKAKAVRQLFVDGKLAGWQKGINTHIYIDPTSAEAYRQLLADLRAYAERKQKQKRGGLL